MLISRKQTLLKILANLKLDIAEAQIKPVIKALLHFVKNDYPKPKLENELISISQRYTSMAISERKDMIETKEVRQENNKITDALLAIIDELKENIEAETITPNPPTKTVEKERLNEPIPNNISEEDLNENHSHKPIQNKTVLKASQLTKKYKRSSNFQLSLEELELKLGTITVLVGENATGKTTLIRLLTGDLAATKGQIDYPRLSNTKRRSWAKVKQQIAYIPQFLPEWHQDLYSSLCYEAVTHGIPAKEVEGEVNYIIHRLGLAAYIDHKWSQLSGGYKLRYALAKALVWHPQLLIIDEPLAHLDIRAQLIVLQDLRQIADSQPYPIAILLSSQHIHEIEHIADQILFMQGGKVENCGKLMAKETKPTYHYFELACTLDKEDLKKVLQQLPHTIHKIQYTGISSIIQTDNSLTPLAFQTFLNEQGIALHFFRNLTQSIKTKFYEKREV